MEKKNKTTDDDFLFFKSECKFWQTVLGLISWKIYYKHEKCGENLAECSTNFEGRAATIRLNTIWKGAEITPNELKTSALHECLEIFLSPLFAIAKSRYYDEAEYTKEHHAIIRTLEKLLENIEVKR